ncbi:MAG: SH3 domain-containing protein [Beijerinckiaceae bacterium]
MRTIFALGLSALALACGAAPSRATEFCLIRKTADGFAALRAAPSLNAKLVARMRTGEEVQLAQGVKGRWREVIYWRGGDRLAKGYSAHTAKGWVDERLLEDCG